MILANLLSRVYGSVIAARNRYWDAPQHVQHVDVPVISIGNLTVGGTGKTPLVLWAAKRLLAAGGKPAVVSRGYRGRAGRGPVVVSDGSGPLVRADVSGDEPALISSALPGLIVVVGSDRVAGARKAIELGCDRILLDDGFQHRRLARNLNILLWDARTLPEEENLLPRGRLREPLDSARRADALVLTHSDETAIDRAVWAEAFPSLPGFTARHQPCGLISEEGTGPPRRVLAFCGIAQPDGFRHTLESQGIHIVRLKAFPDHHDYSDKELSDLATEAERARLPLVTTEKDWVKIRDRTLPQAPGWWRAPIELVIENADSLERMLLDTKVHS